MTIAKCYYVDGYDFNHGGYVVRSSFQGDCKEAAFVCEDAAKDYSDYRNRMLTLFNTTCIKDYKKFRTAKQLKAFNPSNQ